MKYLIGIDIGTAGVKTVLINERGELIGNCLKEDPLHIPRPIASKTQNYRARSARCGYRSRKETGRFRRNRDRIVRTYRRTQGGPLHS